MILLIAAEFSAPPSSPSVFRDVTMYGKIFCHYDVLAECDADLRDFYAAWFKRYGLFDFVDQLVKPGEISSPRVTLSPLGQHGRLTVHELNGVITTMRALR